MIIKDRVYGEVEIKEKVILELLNTPSIQRLKNINQSGYYNVYASHEMMTRFEHSLGCYLLLDKFNASLEEKISGLLHDVSHSVFSHCIDYVLTDSGVKQDYQDNIFNDFILKTEIPEILKKYNFDVDYILDEKNFPLQETDLPDLCADRIDYSLRSFIAFKLADKKNVSEIINGLSIFENNWVFRDVKIAQKYADLFRVFNSEHLCGINSAIMFQRVSAYLKYALKNNYITEKDLYKTEDYVLSKINKNLVNDNKLVVLWDDMNNKYKFESNEKDYDYSVICKSRIIDPKILKDNKIYNLSDINLKWKKVVLKEMKPVNHFIKTYVKKI